jgi:uncharacterized membrane protein
MSKDRLEAFSDGVFAVALTLLVLGLTAPQVAAHSSWRQYAVAMAPLVPKVISFMLSFAVICIHWVSHHYFFSHRRRATLGIVWLNNLLLLWICFLPFPTAMLGNNPTDQFPILLYSVNSLFIALTFFALRSHAHQAKLFVEDDAKTLGPGHSIPAIALYALSIVLVFVSVYLSLLCLLLVPWLYFVPNLVPASSK